MGLPSLLNKTWHFLWHEDSLLSWIVNLALAFVLVKFLLYPGIGFLLGTEYPIVAVVSGSMEHQGKNFDPWWEGAQPWYGTKSITREQFSAFPFHNGFSKGDIMILKGVEPNTIIVGDVVVYESQRHTNPIIHRVVAITVKDNTHFFETKGDNNPTSDRDLVGEEQLQRTGKALLRIPLLGWIKIGFVSLLGGVFT